MALHASPVAEFRAGYFMFKTLVGVVAIDADRVGGRSGAPKARLDHLGVDAFQLRMAFGAGRGAVFPADGGTLIVVGQDGMSPVTAGAGRGHLQTPLLQAAHMDRIGKGNAPRHAVSHRNARLFIMAAAAGRGNVHRVNRRRVIRGRKDIVHSMTDDAGRPRHVGFR